MERSAELKELYIQICEAQTNGDYSFFRDCFSQKDGVVAIGTDPAEWWTGYEAITGVFEAQLKEVAGFEILVDDPLAFSDGSVGWVAGHPALKLPDGRKMQLRLTLVFQKEPDGWKIVQWHCSTGIDNEDLIGETLTT